ncbi:MAG TPA: DUF2007 domain-containing protein [Bacteroidales bacterium]|jgi:hypothetical protein|nr:DUF2007 domain-containing protein [Bacteroidales bacterium]
MRDELIKVFTGSDVSVILLKGLLEETGIPSIIRNEYQSGINAGFFGGVPASVDLLIKESDFSRAEPLIRDFVSKNNIG